MPVITVFSFKNMPGIFEVCEALNGKKFSESWISAKESKYNKDEVFISYWYYELIEENLKRTFSEEDVHEIVSFLKENGKSKVLKRTYCFINMLTKTLEVYRWPDEKTEEIISHLEELLKVKFNTLKLSSEELQKIYSNHATELRQVMFRNVEGLVFDILNGSCLEENVRFKEYLQLFPQSLRAISFRPKIKFLNHGNKYQVTINGDKGTIRLSSNEVFQWRPRYEIRQLIFMIAAIAGFYKL
jgi:hypothetical protein